MPDSTVAASVPVLDPATTPAPTEGAPETTEGQTEGAEGGGEKDPEIAPKVLATLKTLSEEELMEMKRITDKKSYMADLDRDLEKSRQELRKTAEQIRASKLPVATTPAATPDPQLGGQQSSEAGFLLPDGQKWIDELATNPNKALQDISNSIREGIMKEVRGVVSGVGESVSGALEQERLNVAIEDRWSSATEGYTEEQKKVAFDVLDVHRARGFSPTPEQVALEARYGNPGQIEKVIQTLFSQVQVYESQSGQPSPTTPKHPMGAGFSSSNQAPPQPLAGLPQGQTQNGLPSWHEIAGR